MDIGQKLKEKRTALGLSQDETTLAYFVDDQLQWRWEIAPVPVAQLMSRQYGTVSIAPIDWFPAGSFADCPAHMNGLTFHGGESVSILLSGSSRKSSLSQKNTTTVIPWKPLKFSCRRTGPMDIRSRRKLRNVMRTMTSISSTPLSGTVVYFSSAHILSKTNPPLTRGIGQF